MVTLTHPTFADVTVAVPDADADEWIEQGWQPAKKRTPRATT